MTFLFLNKLHHSEEWLLLSLMNKYYSAFTATNWRKVIKQLGIEELMKLLDTPCRYHH